MTGDDQKTDMNEQPTTWKEAFLASPGPRSARETLLLALKGLCMGTADIIPGVSGGTMALITGIYEDLLRAIKSADARMLSMLLSLRWRDALARVHARFLLALFVGIGTAIITLARLMHFLLNHHPVYIWSLFFGLIGASIFLVARNIDTWHAGTTTTLAVGIAAGFLIVGIVPMQTPEAPWFIFLSGFVAICAMILPGISGAFILLILGKYAFITGTLKNPFIPAHLVIIAVFCAGCLAGLLSFSRLLNYLMARYHDTTLACLTGLMIGSMQKIWPWKEVIATKIIRGKTYVVDARNVLPGEIGPEVWGAVGLMVIGFATVWIIDRLSRR